MSIKIAVIDYGLGNVRSILNAFEKIGITPVLTREREVILNADGVVLPGVGAFSHGMKNLQKYLLVDVIKEYALSNKPLLGICLGMQMLFEESEEFGLNKGIGLIEGRIIKISPKDSQCKKLPHISWNEIVNIDTKEPLFANIEEATDVYFVHSYVASPKNKDNIISSTIYSDYEFCSSVKKNNIYGCQFHPEKSGSIGLTIIKNFVNICKGKLL